MNQEILTYNTPNSEKILMKINQYEFKRLQQKNLKKTIEILFMEYIYITASSFINFILDKANIDKTIQYLESKSKFKEI